MVSAGEKQRKYGNRPLRVVIAGGGVAALEALLALRALAEERVEIDLIAPQSEFVYRPLSVLEPFGGQTPRFDLTEIVADQGARQRMDAVAEVDTERGRLRTRSGDELPYDVLLVATGAKAREAIPGALTFGADVRGETFGVLIDELRRGLVKEIVFAIPGGLSWSLPIYELALNIAADLERHRVQGATLTLVTPEERPLALFGLEASDVVRELLDERGIALMTATHPVEVNAGGLLVMPRGYVPAERVMALPRLEALPLPGVPHDDSGFLPTDVHGLVRGTTDIYAAGDVTAFPVKQGGIAAEQADAAATAIAAIAGAPVAPSPFNPILRALLLTGNGDGPRYLAAEVTHGPADCHKVDREPLWWPPSKLFGHYLAPYLALRGATFSERAVPRMDVPTVAFEVDLEAEPARD
jgi:sulfide:quinone oxidoreductase